MKHNETQRIQRNHEIEKYTMPVHQMKKIKLTKFWQRFSFHKKPIEAKHVKETVSVLLCLLMFPITDPRF